MSTLESDKRGNALGGGWVFYNQIRSHLMRRRPIAGERPIPTWRGQGRIRNWQRFRDDLLGILLEAMGYGDEVVRIPVMYNDVYLVNDPDLIRDILIDNYSAYGRAESQAQLQAVIGDGIITADNAAWVAQRKAAAPSFTAQRLRSIPYVVASHTGPWQDDWDRAAAHGEVRSLAKDLMALSSQIAFDYFFGLRISHAEAAGFVDDFITVQTHYHGRIYEPWSRVSPAADAGLARIRRLAGTLVSSPATAHIHPQAMTIIATAPENPSNVLAWTLYLLGRHPDAARRAAEAATQGDDAYLAALVHESVRLYPGAWGFDRRALSDRRLKGYCIPTGGLIVISPYTLHRNPRYWPLADQFHPERFLEVPAQELPPLTYLPFSAGPRKCIGDRFALTVIMEVLRRILVRYRVHLDPRERGEMWPMFTLRPRTGILATLERVRADG